MTKNKAKIRQTGCPVAFGLDIFGDRWTLLVIREIMLRGKRTYSEFMEMEEEIATNILIDRLKSLEAEGLVNKERDPENRRSFLYSLTKKGRDLAPILLEIIIWSGEHDKRSFALTEVLKKIEADREGFESGLRLEKGC
ncbi:transcriptional regulator [Parasedimentitalea marina]|uniref:Transcriptional regulator n=1 Tax=Parasedimentitalea marina TaxID=2483033 RepID=A0A3T0MYS6_9RHOB|nr:helix-turn-helix domain-containing protein [Parasedimentitalea marina]AZV76915.1 transcriptional regulator [Parasedimentitalea marina]